MTILSDNQIKKLCLMTPDSPADWKPMISDFYARQVRFEPFHDVASIGLEPTGRRKILSYGSSSYGYDVRVANKFKIFTNVGSTLIDPLNFKTENYVDFQGDVCIIPPNSFVLASTMEYFNMPADVTGIVVGKSTYARCGVSCICTPLEAGWSGELVLEFANCTPLPVKLYAGQGAAQVMFFKGDTPCDTTYLARGGKYQNQTGIQLPIG